MTVEEIFSKLANHMIKGMMFHEQMANYYHFLGLKGYKRCHEYHFYSETCGFKHLECYYLDHFNKLIKTDIIEDPHIIPDSWYKYNREEVDTNTKRNGVKEMVKKWVDWEKETKQLYQNSYKELYDLGEIAAAMKISCYIKDVDEELKSAIKKFINLQTINYDINMIIEEQTEIHDKYKEKIKNILK